MKVNELVTSLVKLYRYPIIKKIARICVLMCGADITTNVQMGANVKFPHNAIGTVIGASTRIEDNVTIFHGVTLGYALAGRQADTDSNYKFVIKKGAVLCAGAKILHKGQRVIIGENTVIGANSVLLTSTGDNEVWAGNPARKIGIRSDS